MVDAYPRVVDTYPRVVDTYPVMMAIDRETGRTRAETPSVFVVYLSEDEQLARSLVAALDHADIVTDSELALLPGDQWDVEIPRRLRSASIIAVLITENWALRGEVDPDWYAHEQVADAIDHARDEGKRVFPVVVNATKKHLPYGLKRTVAIQLAGVDDAALAKAVAEFERIIQDRPSDLDHESTTGTPSDRAGGAWWWPTLAVVAVAVGVWANLDSDEGPSPIGTDARLDASPTDAAIDTFQHPPPITRPLPMLPFEPDEPLEATPFRSAAVRLPPGTLVLGRLAGPQIMGHDVPPRDVTIDKSLWITTTPITRAQYRAVMGELPEPISFAATPPPTPPDDAPITWVDFDDAVRYCARLSDLEGLDDATRWRLPTEDEWEYACRTDTVSDTASPAAPNRAHLPPTGGPPNAWHLRDMLGVVNQWTSTPYPPDADVGPDSDRALRGGHHQTRPKRLVCSERWSEPPGHRSGFTGFRIVRTAP